VNSLLDAPSSTWFTLSPEWGWLIVLYLFFAGIAAGCYFLAAMIDLAGRPEDRPLARMGYYVALPCLAVSGVLLIFDLSRPDRFWHLMVERHTWLPMFKYWSPMSLGAWALLIFGMFSLLSFVGALAESGYLQSDGARRLRSPGAVGKLIAALGAIAALYIAGYTGVLLAVTNRPIWADTPLLGLLLTLSAASISAAVLVLIARARRWTLPGVAALHRMGGWFIALEFIALVAVVITLGAAARAWLNAWGLLLFFGVVVVGMALPLLLRRRPGQFAAEAVLAIVGGFVLRVVIVLSSESIHL